MTTLILENASAADVTQKMQQLDPDQRYTVIVRAEGSIDNKQAAETLQRVFNELPPDPQTEGLSDAAIMELALETQKEIRAGMNV